LVWEFGGSVAEGMERRFGRAWGVESLGSVGSVGRAGGRRENVKA